MIAEQENILCLLNLRNEKIMSLVIKEFEEDDLSVEPDLYRNRKNIMRIYKGLKILVDRKFEIVMNLILFRNVISKFWEDEVTQEMLIILIHAGMVLTDIRIWRDFIISRDSDMVTKEIYKEDEVKKITAYHFKRV